MPHDAQKFCVAHNTVTCQQMAAMFKVLQNEENETGVVALNEETEAKLMELRQALSHEREAQEMKEKIEQEASKAVTTIFETERTEEKVQELTFQELKALVPHQS